MTRVVLRGLRLRRLPVLLLLALLALARAAVLHVPLRARARTALGGAHALATGFSGALGGVRAAAVHRVPLSNDLPHGSASYYGAVALGSPPQELQVRARLLAHSFHLLVHSLTRPPYVPLCHAI